MIQTSKFDDVKYKSFIIQGSVDKNDTLRYKCRKYVWNCIYRVTNKCYDYSKSLTLHQTSVIEVDLKVLP